MMQNVWEIHGKFSTLTPNREPYCSRASPRGRMKTSSSCSWRGWAQHHCFHKQARNLPRECTAHLLYLLLLGMPRMLTCQGDCTIPASPSSSFPQLAAQVSSQSSKWMEANLLLTVSLLPRAFQRVIQFFSLWRDHHITLRNYLLPFQGFPSPGYFTHPFSQELF